MVVSDKKNVFEEFEKKQATLFSSDEETRLAEVVDNALKNDDEGICAESLAAAERSRKAQKKKAKKVVVETKVLNQVGFKSETLEITAKKTEKPLAVNVSPVKTRNAEGTGPVFNLQPKLTKEEEQKPAYGKGPSHLNSNNAFQKKTTKDYVNAHHVSSSTYAAENKK